MRLMGIVKLTKRSSIDPPIYWAPARCKPAMQGIRNGRQPQLDNTFHELAAGLFMVGYDLRDA